MTKVNGIINLISKGLKASVDSAPASPKNIYETKGAL